ncbi:MAG: AAA family ATPase [Candidatus Riflebacteria bacterium]|nr:AAA family ATPase [Candidatus Riflebacteria bacterium]
MQRHPYRDLVRWKNDPRRKPLVLLGIRQVGKTWLLKEFGRREFEDCAYFNLEEDPTLAALFQGPRFRSARSRSSLFGL